MMRINTVIAIIILTCGLATSHGSISDMRGYRRTATREAIPHLSKSDLLGEGFEIAQQTSNRCFTPYFWCFLPGWAPINTPCWCATPNGPVGGVVR